MYNLNELKDDVKPRQYGYWVLDTGEEIAVSPYGHNDAMREIATAAGDVSPMSSMLKFQYRDFTSYGILKQNAIRVVGASKGLVSMELSTTVHSRAAIDTLYKIVDQYLMLGGHYGILIDYSILDPQAWPIDVQYVTGEQIAAASPDAFDQALRNMRKSIRKTCTVPLEHMQSELASMEQKQGIHEHLAEWAMQEFNQLRS